MVASVSDDQHEGFKAFQAEFGAESAIIVYPDSSHAAFIRVFKDQGGAVRLDLQIARNDGQRPAEHVQIKVGRQQLMRLLEDPQDAEPSFGPEP
jgi:hypothetical protein